MGKRMGMVLGMAIILFVGAPRHAGADNRRALAEELMKVERIQKSTEDTLAMVKQMMANQFKNISKMTGKEVPPSVVATQEKIMDLVTSEMSWDKMKEEFLSLYADTYTEKELKGQIEFYKTPIGQAVINKQPELMKKVMEMNQKKMMLLMPKIQAMVKEALPKTPLPPPPPPPPSPTPPVEQPVK